VKYSYCKAQAWPGIQQAAEAMASDPKCCAVQAYVLRCIVGAYATYALGRLSEICWNSGLSKLFYNLISGNVKLHFALSNWRV